MSNLDELLERLPAMKERFHMAQKWQKTTHYPWCQYYDAEADIQSLIAALEEAQEQLITFRRENRHLTEGIATRDQRIAELEKVIEINKEQYIKLKKGQYITFSALLEGRDERIVEFKATIEMLNSTIRRMTDRIAELEKNYEMFAVFVSSSDRGEHAQIPGKLSDLAAIEIIEKLEADLDDYVDRITELEKALALKEVEEQAEDILDPVKGE